MSDWASETAETIERVVVAVRDKTVAPAEAVAKGIVYGLVAAVLLLIALMMTAIAGFRLLNLVLPVWASYLTIGGILLLVGLLLWWKRSPRLGANS